MRGKVPKKLIFEERILSELNSYLRQRAKDSFFTSISFTKVELNRDYSQAKVYWDSFREESQSEGDLKLDEAKGKLRSHLAKVLEVRHTPALEFCYDNQFHSEKKIEEILHREAKKGKF